MDELRRSMLDRMSQGLADAVKSMRPEDLEPQREMVRDLNQLLGRGAQGDEPSQPEVDGFLAKHGAFFPGAQTLDDVIEQLADRMAAMQSLMRSLSPEQRQELQDTLDALLRDDRLKWDLAQLAANLDQLLPGGLGERVRFTGDQPLGLEAALQQLDRLQALDQLEAQLDGAGGPGDLGEIDRARRPRPARARMPPGTSTRSRTSPTASSGPATSSATATASSSPRAATGGSGRRSSTSCSPGSTATRSARTGSRPPGHGGERDESSKPFEFGDPFHLDLRGTLGNALRREENAPGRRPAGPRSGSGPTTSRCTAPSTRPRRRRSCSST